MKLSDIQQTEWYLSRPELIRKLIDKFPPSASVLIKETMQTAYVYSWNEHNTISVIIKRGENAVNALPGETYRVFGYKPEDLVFLCENPDLYLEADDDRSSDISDP